MMTLVEMPACCPNGEAKLKSREKGKLRRVFSKRGRPALLDSLVVIILSQHIALRHGAFKFGG